MSTTYEQIMLSDEDRAREAGWISGSLVSDPMQRVRNPKYATNNLPNGAWADNWDDALRQDALRAAIKASGVNAPPMIRLALKVWESMCLGRYDQNRLAMVAVFTDEEKQLMIDALLNMSP